MNVADFDAWRERYDDMTYQEMADFYDAVEIDHPLQKAFNANAFDRFLDHASEVLCHPYLGPMRVLEIGGWKGELAREMLEGHGVIIDWCNIEICWRAIEKSVVTSKYTAMKPVDFPWNVQLPNADVFVASHFIEHIREWQLKALLGSLSISRSLRYTGIQAPIPESGENVDWTGYHGTHILEIGWEQVSTILLWFGFVEIPFLRVDDFRAFERPGWPK
jgi:hypothetical protein